MDKRRQKHFGPRMLAYTVDGLLCSGMQILCVVPGGVIGDMLNRGVEPSPFAMFGAFAFMVFGTIASLVWFVMRDRWGSPGRRWMRLKVVHAETGKPCSAPQSLIRNLVLLFLGVIDLIFALFQPEGRTLGDLVAGTRVVRREATVGVQDHRTDGV